MGASSIDASFEVTHVYSERLITSPIMKTSMDMTLLKSRPRPVSMVPSDHSLCWFICMTSPAGVDGAL
jgi:hypothetical protein